MAVNNSYVRPQSEVHQLLSYTISQTNGHGLACIVGSQYDVFRYGKEKVPEISALAASNNVSLPAYLAGTGIIDYVIDKESVHIYAERVMATIGDEVTLSTPTNDDYVTLPAPENKYWAVSDSSDMSKLVATGYSVSVGDFIVNIASGATAKVTKLIPSTDNPKLYDKIVVNRNIYSLGSGATTKVKVGKEYTGDIEVESVKVADNNASLTIEADLEVEVYTPQGMFTATISANQKAYVEFRARVIDASETGIIYLDTVEDIQDKLGAIDVNNELAYACYRALTSAGGRTVAAVRVTEDTADAFLAAMQKTDSNSQVYAFVPVTTNEECISAVVDYNEQMSTPTVQKWRMTFVGAELDTKKPDLVDAENQLLKGTFYKEGDGDTAKHLFQISSMNIDNGFSFTDYVVEDAIVYNDIKYTIKSILAENLVLLTNSPSSITTDVEIKIARTDSAQGNIAQAEKLASSLNSRRVVVVWCDNGRSDGVIMHNAYLAAEIAGLASATEPQAGLTRTEITTIDDAPRMYTRYTQSQLDRVAAHGVLIVTQDTVDGTPYIRHQLTTAPDKGILYSEMSCTRNLDNISYAVADQINTYVGRMNVTPSALQLIYDDLTTLWDSYTANATSDLIGPALVDYYDVSVQQDPVALDRVIVNVTYEIPSPLNRISVYQMTYVARVSINNNEINE